MRKRRELKILVRAPQIATCLAFIYFICGALINVFIYLNRLAYLVVIGD